MTKKNKKHIRKLDAVSDTLNEKQKLFCHLYIHDKECFGNATKTYQKAYGVTYAIAKASGTRLLSNVSIRGFINSELDRLFTSKEVDRELSRVINQDKDVNSKVAGIREFNKLKQRITDKTEIEVKMPKPLLANVFSHLGNTQGSSA